MACVIGLDIGGTKIAGGVVLLPQAEMLSRREIPTRPERGGQAELQDTLALASELLREAESAGTPAAGIGVGVAELVNSQGEIMSSQTIQWRGLPVRESLARLAPAIVDADVRMAALGEALFGAGRAYRTLAYVTVGTGISYSLVQEGRPYAGARGNALVLASGPTSHSCPHCGRRSSQVLEEYASGPAIARRYAARCGRNGVSGEDVIQAAQGGDAVALEIAETAGGALGVAVGFLINVLDPEAIVVGGGLGLCGGRYWESFVESARAHVWADECRDLPILPAALGRDSGVVGAAEALRQSRLSAEHSVTHTHWR